MEVDQGARMNKPKCCIEIKSVKWRTEGEMNKLES